jgi:hypothetical protein
MLHRLFTAAGCAGWVFLWLGHAGLARADEATMAEVMPDGGRYYGPLVDGKLEGLGRIEWDNGALYEGELDKGLFSGHGRLRSASGEQYEGDFRAGVYDGQGKLSGPNWDYEGEFRSGMLWGQGEVRYKNGRTYRGEFVRGQFEGKGRFSDPGSGVVYEGDFAGDEFTGHGIFTGGDGRRQEGQFRSWKAEGPGTLSDGNGNTYEGQFSNGELVGKARITGKDGSRYEGEVKGWTPSGEGELHRPNGDVYRGHFEYGVYEGQGTLTFATPQADGRTQDTGIWRYGRLKKADEDERHRTEANVETALYRQPALLTKALDAMAPRSGATVNLYFLGVAGEGSQEVFRREVDFVRSQFDADFGTRGHSLVLVNSRNTVDSAPMATVTSIRQALGAIAGAMDRQQDILFLFITSHGSRDHEISLGLPGMDLAALSAHDLGAALKESGIRWKVVVLSACYSGGFIDDVRDPNTLVITAARHDRRSFGCADENDFTYFGRAFFKESLPKSSSFEDAFARAERLVTEWEDKDAQKDKTAQGDGETAQSDQHSLPQMEDPPAVRDYLRRWWEHRAHF